VGDVEKEEKHGLDRFLIKERVEEKWIHLMFATPVSFLTLAVSFQRPPCQLGFWKLNSKKRQDVEGTNRLTRDQHPERRSMSDFHATCQTTVTQRPPRTAPHSVGVSSY